jgi:hypothetical protein
MKLVSVVGSLWPRTIVDKRSTVANSDRKRIRLKGGASRNSTRPG